MSPVGLLSVPGSITVSGVSKVFGSSANHTLALDRISLDVAPGEFWWLVGAAGCGKGTLLNLLAGLDAPSGGEVSVAGRTSLMFQESALFPWLSVRGNIKLALRLAGVPKAERQERASDLLRMVRLKGMGGKRPHELSGGMRQRVALARALAQDARILLMDEPFGALDAITRDLLHDELERVWQEAGLTVVFVTHNVREAVRLGASGLFFGAWQIVAWAHVKRDYVLPGPGPVLAKFFTDIKSGVLLHATASTMQRAAFGYAISVVIGVLLGLAVARSRILRAAF